ncbi:unnamed protein product [Choristocarpus tenellus]
MFFPSLLWFFEVPLFTVEVGISPALNRCTCVTQVTMEYEKALFRVYDRSLESLTGETPKAVCGVIQKVFLGIAAVLLGCLVVLHVQIVNQPGCIGDLLEKAADREGLLIRPSTESRKALLQSGASRNSGEGPITINNTVGSIDVPEGWELGNGDNNTDDSGQVILPTGNSISRDVLIGVAIQEYGLRGYPVGGGAGDGDSYSQSFDNVSSANDTGFLADYTFAFEPMVLLLPHSIREEHSFQWVNFTVDPKDCMPRSGGVVDFLLGWVVGYDVAMANMFMFSLRSKGMLKNILSEEEWWWYEDSIPVQGRSWVLLLGNKMVVLFRAVVAFVLMSTVTALTVRTLLSSGIVIVFPIILLMERVRLGERMGFARINMNVLIVSYPWLGMPIEALRRNNKPVVPFIMGHLAQVVVYYSVYNACLLAWSVWLYDKSMTNTLQVWLYAMVMLWEYFSLIFVRCHATIHFFPRATALYFILFHLYFYYFPMGFFSLAAGINMIMLLHCKMFVLSELEVPAFARGEITYEQPRAQYVELPCEWCTLSRQITIELICASQVSR